MCGLVLCVVPPVGAVPSCYLRVSLYLVVGDVVTISVLSGSFYLDSGIDRHIVVQGCT